MSHWSGENRAYTIEAFFKGGEWYVVARRHYRFTINQPRPDPSRTSRTEETINEVVASVRRNPRLSIAKRTAALNVTKSTVERILKPDLEFHPYKIQIVQEIFENNYNLHKSFCQTIIERFLTLNTSI
ncbi:Transposable element Tc3 transposase [Danaus plexippus plexippus]|uniref:Transposable element Tc3 transposase n=1 Tax=Danaus plexippus plexippus TaxID=278856 RepID=A0A212F8V2_DANPL|nr:Transposable element Tc3 transposase [Danaus plexippus plexippus]